MIDNLSLRRAFSLGSVTKKKRSCILENLEVLALGTA
jgi:hypothetical protein